MPTILQKRSDYGITLKPKNYDWFLHIFDMDFGYDVTMPLKCEGLFVRYDELVAKGEINPNNFQIVDISKLVENDQLSNVKGD
jgi:hypothetical protein